MGSQRMVAEVGRAVVDVGRVDVGRADVGRVDVGRADVGRVEVVLVELALVGVGFVGAGLDCVAVGVRVGTADVTERLGVEVARDATVDGVAPAGGLEDMPLAMTEVVVSGDVATPCCTEQAVRTTRASRDAARFTWNALHPGGRVCVSAGGYTIRCGVFGAFDRFIVLRPPVRTHICQCHGSSRSGIGGCGAVADDEDDLSGVQIERLRTVAGPLGLDDEHLLGVTVFTPVACPRREQLDELCHEPSMCLR